MADVGKGTLGTRNIPKLPHLLITPSGLSLPPSVSSTQGRYSEGLSSALPKACKIRTLRESVIGLISGEISKKRVRYIYL
jgi:hypothetical protein